MVRALLCATLLLTACADSSGPAASGPSAPKSEAETFALSVVQAIIEGDARAFQASLADTIYFLEPHETPVPKGELPVTDVFE